MKNKIFFLLLITFLLSTTVRSQNTDEVYFQAMNDEMHRSLSDLKLDKYLPPFFLSYSMADVQSFFAAASLGNITMQNYNPSRSGSVRMMLGDYSLNDENFVGSRSSSGGVNLPMPIESDYWAIRRSLWSQTDRIYKNSIENYEQKLTALKQKNEQDTVRLDDFSRIKTVEKILPDIQFSYDRNQWENTIKELSAEFNKYGDFTVSAVTIYFIKSYYYHLTNEGTKIKAPSSIAILCVNAGTLAKDGEMLTNQLDYTALTPAGLPSKEKIAQDIRTMADLMVKLRNAPVVKKSYAGPVVFEGEAAAQMASQVLFARNGLISTREQVYASDRRNYQTGNLFDDRVGQRICSNNITIKAIPKQKTYSGTGLVGSFDVDAEGVVPPDELLLVEKGILRNLLNDRVPTAAANQSNGHSRVVVGGTATRKGPGVIMINYDKGSSLKKLYNDAAKEAVRSGFDYYYIVRKIALLNIGLTRNKYLSSTIDFNLPLAKPIAIYRVSVKTGKEELVRSVIFSDFSFNNLKYVNGATSELQVYNNIDVQTGLPYTYIMPYAITLNDLPLLNHKNQTRLKLPVVPNPLANKD